MKLGAFLLFGRTKQPDLHRTSPPAFFAAFRWQLGVVSKITGLALSTINRGKFLMRAARSPEQLNSRCSPSSSASQYQPRPVLSRQNIVTGRWPSEAVLTRMKWAQVGASFTIPVDIPKTRPG